MENRYLFRAQRTDNRDWVEGHLVSDEQNPGRFYIGYLSGVDENGGVHDTVFVEIDPSTICQCTGRKGYKGNELKLIFEGDVVSFRSDWISGYGGVLWNHGKGAYRIRELGEKKNGKGRIYSFYGDAKYEIRGNVFDNPELL